MPFYLLAPRIDSYVARALPCSLDIGFEQLHSQLAVPSHRLSTYGRRAFAIVGPTTWNSLPTHLRRVENSTAAFGRSLKTRLFSEY